jgi:hypothetical protein
VLRLVLGIWLPWAGQAAGVGLLNYFVGAVVSHLRVRDIKGIGPALFMLMVAAGGARPARANARGKLSSEVFLRADRNQRCGMWSNGAA